MPRLRRERTEREQPRERRTNQVERVLNDMTKQRRIIRAEVRKELEEWQQLEQDAKRQRAQKIKRRKEVGLQILPKQAEDPKPEDPKPLPSVSEADPKPEDPKVEADPKLEDHPQSRKQLRQQKRQENLFSGSRILRKIIGLE